MSLGASNRIGRSITVMVCDCIIVDKNNTTHEETVKLYGDLGDAKRAQNAVRKKLDNSRVLVKNWHKESFYASMKLEDFIKQATITEHEPEEMEI